MHRITRMIARSSTPGWAHEVRRLVEVVVDRCSAFGQLRGADDFVVEDEPVSGVAEPVARQQPGGEGGGYGGGASTRGSLLPAQGVPEQVEVVLRVGDDMHTWRACTTQMRRARASESPGYR